MGQSFVILVLDVFIIIHFRSDSFTASKFTAADAFALLLPTASPNRLAAKPGKIKEGGRAMSLFQDLFSFLFPGRFPAQVFLFGDVNADYFAVGDEQRNHDLEARFELRLLP